MTGCGRKGDDTVEKMRGVEVPSRTAWFRPLLDQKPTHGAESLTSAMTLHLRRWLGGMYMYVCLSYRGYKIEVILRTYRVQLNNFWIKKARTDEVIPCICKNELGVHQTPVFHIQM